MKNRRVVVTGMGALTPIGNNINEFWQNLVEGKSGADNLSNQEVFATLDKLWKKLNQRCNNS